MSSSTTVRRARLSAGAFRGGADAGAAFLAMRFGGAFRVTAFLATVFRAAAFRAGAFRAAFRATVFRGAAFRAGAFRAFGAAFLDALFLVVAPARFATPFFARFAPLAGAILRDRLPLAPVAFAARPVRFAAFRFAIGLSFRGRLLTLTVSGK
jgi:hypothetical protein